MKLAGWLLDVYIQGNTAILWIKTDGGKAVRLVDSYAPDFYVKSRNSTSAEEFAAIVSEHPHVLEAAVEWKYPSVSERKKVKVLHIKVDSTQNFNSVLNDLERSGRVSEWFNTDILHVQRYLYGRGFAPGQSVEVKHTSDRVLMDLAVTDCNDQIRPPSFTSLIFRLRTSSEKLSPDAEKDPIKAISILGEDLTVKETFEGDEERIFKDLVQVIQKQDPDFLIVSEDDEAGFPYLLERMRKKGMGLQLGREPQETGGTRRSSYGIFFGRIPLSVGDFYGDGVAGIVEKSCFAMIPLGLASRWAPGRIIDSRQCYEAMKRNILVPKLRRPPMYETTAMNLIFMDRGGLILSPVTGLHENIAALDFESMFPNILIKHNISYETVTQQGIDGSRQGFLGGLTKHFLDRRLHFKHLKKKFSPDSPEWLWCEQRQTALKQILVCIYGFSGCDVNRYGNVYTYSKINEVSRELLVKTLRICRNSEYRVIYADCDAVFVKRKGASEQDYEELAKRIQEEIGLPIALDHLFKFLVLLTQESDPNIEAVRHYFGKLMDGELFYRGIELRRHDYPAFLKEFETNLLGVLFDADKEEEVRGRQYEKAREYVVKSMDALASGEVPTENLVVSKILRQPMDTYRSMLPHVSAAMQLIQNGKRLQEGRSAWGGRSIDFVFVNADHPNPLRRVMPAEMINGDHHYYDCEKYQEMLLDVAETVLGWNGFKRECLGLKVRQRSFLEELRTDSRQEILREIMTLEGEEEGG